MNTINLSRREELCRNLNMNFDEASELFSDQTLESMQMAKVNGGSGFCKEVGKILAGVAVDLYVWCSTDDDKPTSAITVDKNGKQYLTGTNIQVDSMKVIDGQVYYWLKGPEPTNPTNSNSSTNPTYGGGGRSF